MIKKVLGTHIMKNKQPKISNYFETSQILVLIKQPDQSFYQSLSNVHPKFQGKNEKFQKKSENFRKNQKISEKIRKFQKKSVNFRKNQKISGEINFFLEKSKKTMNFGPKAKQLK